jgi:hypothetical protein
MHAAMSSSLIETRERPVDAPGEVHGRGAGLAQQRGLAPHLVAIQLLVAVRGFHARGDECDAHGAGDPERRSAPHREALDVVDQLGQFGDASHLESVRKQSLVDEFDGSVNPVDRAQAMSFPFFPDVQGYRSCALARVRRG